VCPELIFSRHLWIDSIQPMMQPIKINPFQAQPAQAAFRMRISEVAAFLFSAQTACRRAS
jgi:hypothetical protein